MLQISPQTGPQGNPAGSSQASSQEQTEETAADWAARLASASPHAIIEAAARALPGRLSVVSSFGTESAVLLKFVADVDRSLPVLFLDTLWLFKETLAYRDVLAAHLGLSDVRTITPSPSALANHDPKSDLCFLDQDACCHLRKVAPLARELEPFAGWISGRKRFQGGMRAGIPVVETDGARLKFNPFANVSREQIEAIYREANLPPHPLAANGYLSVGCMPCTGRTSPDEDTRAGRWRGRPKTECGIHAAPAS